MRPNDLLHLIKFNLSLLPTRLHPHVTGVQVTAETSRDLTVHIFIQLPGAGARLHEFVRSGEEWRPVGSIS